MNKYRAIQSFWESFGWAAYNENSVPDDAMARNNGKYITYEAATDSIGNALFLSATLWHRSTSWQTIHAKVSEIAGVMQTEMPPALMFDDGLMVVRMGEPFAQDEADDDPGIRRVRLGVHVEFLSEF